MAEALTVEVEMDEAVEDFDGEIDEQSATNPPSGADHGETLTFAESVPKTTYRIYRYGY